MADIEKVIKGLEHCLSRYIDGLCDNCLYMGELDKSYMVPMKCKEIIMRDALEILKPAEPVYYGKAPHCKECGRLLYDEWIVCPVCGKRVKWK